MDEESIYTCHRTHQYSKPEIEIEEIEIEENLNLKQSSKSKEKPNSLRFKRKDQIEEGPWYMKLKNIIKKQKISKEKLIKRNLKKKQIRKIKNQKNHQFQFEKKRKLNEEEEEKDDINSNEEKEEEEVEKVEIEKGKEIEKDHEIEIEHTSFQPQQPITSTSTSVTQEKRTEPNPEFPESLNHLLPSSSLLISIHETVSNFYTQQNLMFSRPIKNVVGRPSKKKKLEPKQMLKSLHGSALIGLGVLIEEMAREEVLKVEEPLDELNLN